MLGQRECGQPMDMLIQSAAAHQTLWMKAKAALRHDSQILLARAMEMSSAVVISPGGLLQKLSPAGLIPKCAMLHRISGLVT